MYTLTLSHKEPVEQQRHAGSTGTAYIFVCDDHISSNFGILVDYAIPVFEIGRGQRQLGVIMKR